MEKTLTNGSVETMTSPDYRNVNLSVEERTKDLLGRMTLEEKVAQMLCIWGQKKTLLFDDQNNFDQLNFLSHFKDGLGQIARLSDSCGGLSARTMAELSNKIQRFFIEETRLGIPVIFHEECLHGIAGKDATSYPQPIGLASTFNPDLIEKIYSSIAEDTRSRGAHQALTPVVDVARDARWGRVEETFGEDPYLVAQMGVAAVRGFQGDGTFKDKKKVIATLKHFAAHGQPESGTNCAPVNVSERVLRDTFLFPFKEAIEKANAMSVMASYNEIDGVPSHANKWLLRDVLRGEWGFKGFVVSDYYAVTELNHREEAISHSLAKDKSEAARLAVEAGVNLETPDPDCYPLLVELVHTGKVAEGMIDELVSALLRYKFLLGLFDDPYVDPIATDNDVRLEKERSIALTAARETITLLKNDSGILPLNVSALKNRTIAVIGPNANRIMLGGYSGQPKYFTSVFRGISEKTGSDVNILHSEGCKITVGGSWNDDPVFFPSREEDEQSIQDAVETAKRSDLVILVLGENEQTSREAWNKTHMGDRASIELIGRQNDLAKAVFATGKPVIVVFFNGRPNSFEYVNTNAQAVLECWYLGQEAGVAVADVLFGSYNPSGKLPISIPRSSGHIPAYYNYKPSARRGYLADDISPFYPFGFGLSYSTFQFRNVRLEKTSMRKNESTRIMVDVTNTSSRSGVEVVQMYIRDQVSSVTRPVKELKGFEKVFVKSGETITVTFPISPEHLAFTDINMNYTVEPGDFFIMVGNSSRDQDLQKVTLTVQQ